MRLVNKAYLYTLKNASNYLDNCQKPINHVSLTSLIKCYIMVRNISDHTVIPHYLYYDIDTIIQIEFLNIN